MVSLFLSFLIAAAVSIAAGPCMIRLLARLKVRQTISEDAPERHMQKQGTPTMGGLIVLIGMAAGIATGLLTGSGPDPGPWAVVLMTLVFAALGFLDDYLIVRKGKNLGLKARHKLLGQFAIAIIFVVCGHYLRFVSTDVPLAWDERSVDLGWAYYPLAVLLIVGMSNAVNLTDGLDGLAAGLTTSVSMVLGMLVLFAEAFEPAAISSAESAGLVVPAMALAGGCLGFLWYNSNPARIFMGDTGSLAIGGGLAGIALAGKQELVFLFLGAIFIFEALSVTMQVISFKTTGKRIFKMTPIHHHFELSGWPEQKIVTRFWILQSLIALAVLAWVLR